MLLVKNSHADPHILLILCLQRSLSDCYLTCQVVMITKIIKDMLKKLYKSWADYLLPFHMLVHISWRESAWIAMCKPIAKSTLSFSDRNLICYSSIPVL